MEEQNKYEQWAEKELANLKTSKEVLLDDLVTNGLIVKVDKNGEWERLEPGTQEWWKAKDSYIAAIDPYQIDNPSKPVEVSIFKNGVEFKSKKENGTE